MLEVINQGPYIKYVGGGGGGAEDFCGGHEIYKHILMGHEIFFKIFDGPQNIFLGSIFKILFFKFQSLCFFKRFKKDMAC